MPEEPREILHLELVCDVRAPGRVREALNELAEIALVREDARLVASELVTNAVVHSACRPDDLIEVCAELSRDRLLISVHDPGISDASPRPKSEGRRARGGFGLRIVQRIARRWGTERSDGRLVWAEIAV